MQKSEGTSIIVSTEFPTYADDGGRLWYEGFTMSSSIKHIQVKVISPSGQIAFQDQIRVSGGVFRGILPLNDLKEFGEHTIMAQSEIFLAQTFFEFVPSRNIDSDEEYTKVIGRESILIDKVK